MTNRKSSSRELFVADDVCSGASGPPSDDVYFSRLKVLRAALGLELNGFMKKGSSAYSIIKNEYDLKGNRESVYRQFNALCVDKGLENRPRPGSPLADNEYTGVDVFGEGASDEVE